MLGGYTQLSVTAVPSTSKINTPSAWSKPQHDSVHRQGRTPFDDPSFRQDNEAVLVAAAHDLQFPGAGAGDGSLHLAPLITRVADDALDEWKAASCLPQQRLCTVSILDACRMDADGQQQAERIGQDVALAAKHLLASVIAGGVERSPPLTAPFAVWLSMIAVVGLASRPACSRTST